MTYWVYILASKPGGTLYVGVTNDLVRRVYEHREGLADGFTKRYGVKTWCTLKRTKQLPQRHNVRRISSIGRATGKSI